MTIVLRRTAFGLGAAALAAPRIARAQAWPSKPVRVIVPYGAGNQGDLVARLLCEELGSRLGQRLVVENVPGATGAIGIAQLARAAPDGYTLAVVAIAALAIAPHVQRTGYDPLTDLSLLGGVSVSRDIFVVNAALGVRTMADFLKLARSRPANDPLFYFSQGNGTIPHLSIEILRRALDFPATHVPYRTVPAGFTDLVAGRVQFALNSSAVALPHVQSGGMVALFAASPQRLPALPDVPTLAEIAPGVEVPYAWMSLVAPRGLPPEIATRLARETHAIVSSPEFAARLPAGSEPYPLTAEEATRLLAADYARFGKVVPELNIQPS